MIVASAATIKEGYSDPTVFENLNRTEVIEVNTGIKGLNRDLEIFTDQLLKIKALHEDRSGGVKDDDEFLTAVNIADQYSTHTNNFQAVVTPNHRFLVSKLATAIERRDPKEPTTEAKEATNE